MEVLTHILTGKALFMSLSGPTRMVVSALLLLVTTRISGLLYGVIERPGNRPARRLTSRTVGVSAPARNHRVADQLSAVEK
jgi:peptidoglycan/LPS O-acetylase OafA/YrhL